MNVILSLAHDGAAMWAAGPSGLFAIDEENLQPIPQPQERLSCCAAIHDRLLVGGGPHVVAYLHEDSDQWQAAWTDDCHSAALCLAPAPDIETSGILLAGTEVDGVLRSTDRGHRFSPVNFGLRSYTVLSLAWAPDPVAGNWPGRDVVFAGTEEGLYRSPNAGRAWRRAECGEAPYQTIAVSPGFATDGRVLAGTEEKGLWLSADGGRSFHRQESAPDQVNALCALPGGWLLSDDEGLWRSSDGENWRQVPDSPAALVLQEEGSLLYAGTENGLTLLDVDSLAVVAEIGIPVTV